MPQPAVAIPLKHPTISFLRMVSPEGEIQEQLEELLKDAGARGVELVVDIQEEELWLGHIERKSAPRGSGANVLQELLDLADDWSLPVRCAVDASAEALLEWYFSLGFHLETTCDETGGRRDHAILARDPEFPLPSVSPSRFQEA
ncbi:hypothetical protein [Sphingomonas sp. 3-13AW]|uniref:hypothetical protein n=1 Tax=Sphingomonas sp. 3-13AW TaxID=3050450 RepID=UPI003BB7003E